MKKILLGALLSASLCLLFAQESAAPSQAQIKFVKGNVSDKIAAVKSSGEGALAKKAVDFVVENAPLLKDDRDLAGLAVAGILSYPAEEYKKNPKQVLQDFSDVFYAFDDTNVRVSVLEKISAFYEQKAFSDWTAFVNGYLTQKIAAASSSDDTVKKSVAALGVIGNGSSFGVLHSIIQQNIWTDLHPLVYEALTKIADKSLNEIFDVVDKAELVELKLLSKIFIKNDKISPALRSEIAEKALNRSMILSGTSSNSQDLAGFQLETVKVLADNKWTRASDLAKDYFNVAKIAYNGKFLTAEQWTSAISCVEVLASRAAVSPFTEYLDQMNKAQESGNAPDKAVVLAVINALANLGDKSSFDCLLYVTYVKDYPEEVAVAARNALTRLKW
ncbi:MAG: hypothetical protein IJS51_06220 [Treponema sp.]|nr:hypothetical protein [Treponema sp.]MBQ7619707.1 hypothetical protein [Treponema sp.]